MSGARHRRDEDRRPGCVARGRIETHRAVKLRTLTTLRTAKGQSMVEFALVLPLLVTLIFAMVQLGLILSDYLRVTDAARIGARAAAVARFAKTNPCAAAASAVPPDLAGSVICSGAVDPGARFTVKVSIQRTIDLPLLPFSSAVDLKGSATERIE